jgi:Putative prokaryotic signal transducing protein
VIVRVRIAAGESEAEVVCGLLRSEGIRCFHRPTDAAAHAEVLSPLGWREVLVNEEDLARARELLDATAESAEECSRCGHTLDRDGGWFPDEGGELRPYCGVCAERLFGPYGLAS